MWLLGGLGALVWCTRRAQLPTGTVCSSSSGTSGACSLTQARVVSSQSYSSRLLPYMLMVRPSRRSRHV